jgi:DNA primase
MLNYGLIRQSEDGTYYDLFLDKIIFPIHNEKGFIVGLSGRTLKKDDAVKYINSPESKIFKKSSLIYHLYQALPSIRKQKRIILTEGYMDVISMDQAGFNETVATMGTSLTKEHVSLLSQITDHVILAYDGDQAGNQATLKAIEAFNKTKVKLDVLIFKDKLDPDEYIKKHGAQSLENHIQHHLKDPYDYRYDMYKQNRDLKNSHDMVAFKDDIIKMIKDADPSVQALYKERLAIELNIDVSFIQVKSKNNESLQLKKKESKKTLPNRYFLSEVGLIIAMMQDKKYALKASNELSNNHFADSHMAVLRYQIIKHYESYNQFEIEVFKKQLKDDYLLKFESNVLNDLDYIKKLRKDDKMVDEYIAFIKQSITQRRIDKLIEKRKEHPENAILYVSERDTLIKNMNGDIKS